MRQTSSFKSDVDYCASDLVAVNWLYGGNCRVSYPIPELAEPSSRDHGKLKQWSGSDSARSGAEADLRSVLPVV